MKILRVAVLLRGGDQLPIPTRYKILAKSRGLYTCNVKVLAWGGTSPPPPRPRMLVTGYTNYEFMNKKIVCKFKITNANTYSSFTFF